MFCLENKTGNRLNEETIELDENAFKHVHMTVTISLVQ